MFGSINMKMKRTLVLVAGIGVLGSGVWISEWVFYQEQTVVFADEQQEESLTDGTQPIPEIQIAVHISGAVQQPGLYYYPEGSRVDEAIQDAILLEEADLTAINLAAPLRDGQKVHIPTEEERMNDPWESPLININTAEETRLTELPGIGPVTAQKIVRHRQQTGPFLEVEDLLDVDGIGPARLAEIRDQVTLY